MTSEELNRANGQNAVIRSPSGITPLHGLRFFVSLAVVIGVFANWHFRHTEPTNVTHAVTATAD